MPLGLKKVLRVGFEDALAQVPEALKAEGFGVLTEIDVADTLKRKLDVDFRRYRIVAVDPMQNPAAREDSRVRKVDETVRVKLGRVLAHLE